MVGAFIARHIFRDIIISPGLAEESSPTSPTSPNHDQHLDNTNYFNGKNNGERCSPKRQPSPHNGAGDTPYSNYFTLSVKKVTFPFVSRFVTSLILKIVVYYNRK